MSTRTRHHSTRAWFPTALKDQLEWATRHISGLEEVGTLVGVPTAFTTQARSDLASLRQLYDWRDKVDDLSKSYTQAAERLQWGDGSPDPVVTQPVDPALLGINKTVSRQPALFPRLFNNIDTINKNPACKDDIRRQLAILPPEKPAIDLLHLTPDARATFSGGYVTIKGHLPKPARFWQVHADYGDGEGRHLIGTITRARYIDQHPLPAKPVTWTYTIELHDTDGRTIGKVSVTSLTVWLGRADDGPEAEGG
ncbi:MAG: hypothetical protein LBK99_19855 [Opitutaceae bacterium]|jgi:hypothetical protein|nr:hypothetical protein [Opitutaceae bacterium]